MKYKFKLWNYSIFSSQEAEAMLNEMAAEGWNLRCVLPPLASFERATPGSRRQYTIEILPPGVLDVDYIEEKELKEYYADLGWDFVMRLSSDGEYLFSSDATLPMPKAYADEEERVTQYRNRKKWGPVIAGMCVILPWLLSISLNAGSMEQNIWMYIPLALALLLWLMKSVPQTLATICYVKLGRQNFWTKVFDYTPVMVEATVLILLILGLVGNSTLLVRGYFLNGCSDKNVFALAWSGMLPAPVFLLSKYFGLIARRNAWTLILCTGAFFVACVGALTGPTVIGLQMGWWN